MLLTYVLLHTCSFIRNLFARDGQLFYMWEGKGNLQSRILKLALILQNMFFVSQKNFSHLLLFLHMSRKCTHSSCRNYLYIHYNYRIKQAVGKYRGTWQNSSCKFKKYLAPAADPGFLVKRMYMVNKLRELNYLKNIVTSNIYINLFSSKSGLYSLNFVW